MDSKGVAIREPLGAAPEQSAASFRECMLPDKDADADVDAFTADCDECSQVAGPNGRIRGADGARGVRERVKDEGTRSLEGLAAADEDGTVAAVSMQTAMVRRARGEMLPPFKRGWMTCLGAFAVAITRICMTEAFYSLSWAAAGQEGATDVHAWVAMAWRSEGRLEAVFNTLAWH